METTELKFYNMLIHLIKNNRLFEENVAIKNIWEKEGNVFLDIYFYKNQKSYVFDSVFIHDILDLTNEKYYQNVTNFVADFFNETSESIVSEDNKSVPFIAPNKNIFQPLYVDIIIFVFVGSCTHNFTSLKKDIIAAYIRRQIPNTKNVSMAYIEDYLETLSPSEDDFYNALTGLITKRQDEVENLSRELLKLALSDGRLTYIEKMYIAELLQVLRTHGLKIDLGL